jgi:hypothetical protein
MVDENNNTHGMFHSPAPYQSYPGRGRPFCTMSQCSGIIDFCSVRPRTLFPLDHLWLQIYFFPKFSTRIFRPVLTSFSTPLHTFHTINSRLELRLSNILTGPNENWPKTNMVAEDLESFFGAKLWMWWQNTNNERERRWRHTVFDWKKKSIMCFLWGTASRRQQTGNFVCQQRLRTAVA